MAVGCWIIWANARLAVWRESLLRGEEAPGRSDAHTRIGATLGPAGTPSGADAGMGTKGRGLGAVLGLPVLAPVAGRRAARAEHGGDPGGRPRPYGRPGPGDGLLTAEVSERIDAELSAHFARAIKGFGLIS